MVQSKACLKYTEVSGCLRKFGFDEVQTALVAVLPRSLTKSRWRRRPSLEKASQATRAPASARSLPEKSGCTTDAGCAFSTGVKRHRSFHAILHRMGSLQLFVSCSTSKQKHEL